MSEVKDAVVAAIQKVSAGGMVIPYSWLYGLQFKEMRGHSGAMLTDMRAVVVLAEIVRWWKPCPKIDEHGEVLGFQSKFEGDWLQTSYAKLGEKLGVGKDQIRRACCALVEKKAIVMEFKDAYIDELLHVNVLHVRPVAETLLAWHTAHTAKGDNAQ